jgi:hypothetical protein
MVGLKFQLNAYLQLSLIVVIFYSYSLLLSIPNENIIRVISAESRYNILYYYIYYIIYIIYMYIIYV